MYKLRWNMVPLIVAFGIASCASPDDGRRDAGARCSADSDCDDTIACTVDSCAVGGMCQHTTVDALCPMGESCDLAQGCTAATSCTMDTECDDALACTIDSCGVGNTCRHMALNELCAAGESCDPVMGCVMGTGCTADGDCDDSIDCTLDTCGVGGVCSNTPVAGRCATGETCSPTLGCYVPMPCSTPMDCQDGNFCNGAEICMPEFGCAPAPTARMCDDTDDCTVDTCNTTADMCVFTCDTSRPACMCPVDPPSCDGMFRLTGSTSFDCYFGGVYYDFSTATFTNADGTLSVRPRSSSFAPGELTDVTEPVCPDFDVWIEVTGGCTERYRLHGSFTDLDNFTATLEVTFAGSCAPMVTGCTAQSAMVSGTRM